MRRILFYLFCCFFCLVSFSPDSAAQRTSNKTVHLGISQQVSCYSIPSGGLDLSGGMYFMHSYWKAGISATDYNQKISGTNVNGEYFDHVHFIAYGEWMYRIFATYSRNINLYAGGGIFLGCNAYELFRSLPKEYRTGFPSAEFIYGLRPSIEMEAFVSRNVALVLGVHSPITFSSSVSKDIWHVVGSLGVRVNL